MQPVSWPVGRFRRHLVVSVVCVASAASMLGSLSAVAAPAAPARAGMVAIGTPRTDGALSTSSVPTPPVANPFTAPRCPGTTDHDPSRFGGSVPDLTKVFGGRLSSYNDGHVVPLYDAWGQMGDKPPMCGVRYSARAGGPVSQWLYCTDLADDACAGVNTDGDLTDDGTVVNPMTDLPQHPTLTADQVAIVSYLIQHGHSYHGFGGYDYPVDTATSDEGSAERRALQTLIWCVTDDHSEFSQTGADQTCNENIDAGEQQRILSHIVSDPRFSITAVTAGAQWPGQPARFQVRTNIRATPISLSVVDRPNARLRLCRGSATLNGDTLRLPRSSDGSAATVDICIRAADGTGRFRLRGSVTPSAVQHLRWAQSQNGPTGEHCQVYATFSPRSTTLRDQAVIRILARPSITTTTSDRVAAPGVKLHDVVRIDGLVGNYHGTARASLYGPFTTRAEVDCLQAHVTGAVGFHAHNGQLTTPAVIVHKPGYYTWRAGLSGDSANTSARHRCGLRTESTLVRRVPLHHRPHVETGFSGVVAKAGRALGSIRLARLGIDAHVFGAGIRDGEMQLQDDVSRVSMLRRTARPGDAIGTVVVAGHVSDQHDGPGALWPLHRAERGDRIEIRMRTGAHVTYRVTRVRSYQRDKIPLAVFSTTGLPRLALITCTGIVRQGDRFHYTRNLVVTAVPVA